MVPFRSMKSADFAAAKQKNVATMKRHVVVARDARLGLQLFSLKVLNRGW
jgi:hypothetical protein